MDKSRPLVVVTHIPLFDACAELKENGELPKDKDISWEVDKDKVGMFTDEERRLFLIPA